MFRFIVIAAFATGLAVPVLAGAPTPAERGQIEAALRGAGYVTWGGIEVPPSGARIIVENARRAQDGPARSVLV